MFAMAELITLEQAKDALRIPHSMTEQDAKILRGIKGASEIVLDYMNQSVDWYDPETDTAAAVPFRVQIAVERLVIFDHDEPLDDAFQSGRLPAAVSSILYSLRKLALA